MPEKLRAVLIDVDGTLIDSNDAHAHSWVDAGREHGFTFGFADVRRMIGMGGDKVLPELTGLSEDSTAGRQFMERRKSIFRSKYLPALRPFPRVRELLERMRADGLELVVASSAGADELDALLRQAGVSDLLAGRTSSDDAEESKPAPDIVEAALEQCGRRSDEAVMLGDTPYDVQAAGRAGVRVIALRCGGWEDQALANANEIFDDAADLLEHYNASLLGQPEKK